MSSQSNGGKDGCLQITFDGTEGRPSSSYRETRLANWFMCLSTLKLQPNSSKQATPDKPRSNSPRNIFTHFRRWCYKTSGSTLSFKRITFYCAVWSAVTKLSVTAKTQPTDCIKSGGGIMLWSWRIDSCCTLSSTWNDHHWMDVSEAKFGLFCEREFCMLRPVIGQPLADCFKSLPVRDNFQGS